MYLGNSPPDVSFSKLSAQMVSDLKVHLKNYSLGILAYDLGVSQEGSIKTEVKAKAAV